MNQNTMKLLFPLLKYALDGTRLNDSERELCTEEVISDVISTYKFPGTSATFKAN